MKKKLIVCILSLIAFRGAEAISTNYYESLNEVEALLHSELVSKIIPPGEFVIRTNRITHHPDTFFPSHPIEVKYVITTSGVDQEDLAPKLHKYRAIIEVSPNSRIGNPLLKVISVKQVQ